MRIFRHTFGSWLVQAGVVTFVVGSLMGHKDSKMVERYYGHLAPKNKSEAMGPSAAVPALSVGNRHGRGRRSV
jgi:integrase